MFIPSHNFHFVCFISGNLGHLNAFAFPCFISEISALWAQLKLQEVSQTCFYLWKHFQSIGLCLTLFLCWKPWGKPRGVGAWGGCWPLDQGKRPQWLSYSCDNKLFISWIHCSTATHSTMTLLQSITSHYYTLHVIKTHLLWCFLLSWWIYEKPKTLWQLAKFTKAKKKAEVWSCNQFCRLEWWESFVSFIFCWRADSNLFNRISSGTVQRFIDGVIAKVHAYCSSNDSVCFETW